MLSFHVSLEVVLAVEERGSCASIDSTFEHLGRLSARRDKGGSWANNNSQFIVATSWGGWCCGGSIPASLMILNGRIAYGGRPITRLCCVTILIFTKHFAWGIDLGKWTLKFLTWVCLCLCGIFYALAGKKKKSSRCRIGRPDHCLVGGHRSPQHRQQPMHHRPNMARFE